MSISKGTVVSVVTVGGEYIGKLKDQEGEFITLEDPHTITPNGQSIGFLPAVCMTGKQKPAEVKLNKALVLLMIESQDEVVREYRSATSGLVLPS